MVVGTHASMFQCQKSHTPIGTMHQLGPMHKLGHALKELKCKKVTIHQMMEISCKSFFSLNLVIWCLDFKAMVTDGGADLCISVSM